ncbi:hypothetical protein B7P43_G09726 [Cryptotermes secundus]|uniref:Chitin-binding type-2 domain-containing protein n=1 Tax=Cryptotermes secundus TaxID=105785 RepID=A0A2J7QS12_9NEOP|nr:uncharacterized protein LOC111865761 [Cryptotermes secundus]PNF31384.1 hypothetical protein B7P43_G09726 [Cryptotermes secundus]
MKTDRRVTQLVPQMVLVLFLATTVAAYSSCLKSFVCTNATHFRLCIDHGNGSVSLWERHSACPLNSVCNASQCYDVNPAWPYPPGARKCSSHGFICTNSNQYQLCRYDQQGRSYPWGPYYDCPPSSVCNESHPYRCQILHPSPYVPSTTAHSPSPTKDECKSKNFVCVDSNTYLMCRDVGNGVFQPFNQQLKCPSTQTCHKSFDRPCAVAKSGGNSICTKNLAYFSVVLQLYILYRTRAQHC